MRRISVVAVLVLAMTGGWTSPKEETNPPTATVVRVIDGDTIVAQIGTVEETIRLIGVDAPETGQCLASEATLALETLISNGSVRLQADVSERDRFGRLLRYVFVGDKFANRELVTTGLAEVRLIPPDIGEAAGLVSAQTEAQHRRIGMWKPGACD